jgi:hypothetical protein
MLEYNAARRQERDESPNGFAHDGYCAEALVPPARDHEHFTRPFGLLHTQPAFGALHRFRGGGQGCAEIQRSRSPEADLVERVLERASGHTRQRIEERNTWPSRRSRGDTPRTSARVGAMSTTRANSSYLPGLKGGP